MARVWAFHPLKDGTYEPQDDSHKYGFETFDYGNQIGIWVRGEGGDVHFARLSCDQAVEFGKALLSVKESDAPHA